MEDRASVLMKASCKVSEGLTEFAVAASANQEELVTNVAKYSGLGESDSVGVSLVIDRDKLSLEVRDSGAAFDPLSEGQRAELGADIDHARVGGLGVHLITQLTDTQSYRRDNNENILTVTRSIAANTDR